MLGSLCLLCHGYTISCFISSSISGISIHILASSSRFWICFGLLVLCSGLCLRGEGGVLVIATDSRFPMDGMHIGATSAIVLTVQWVEIMATERSECLLQ